MWIDTHCHLDAAEFDADRDDVVARARAAGVAQIVIPAVDVANFERVRELAHRHRLAYALGIHPMCTDAAGADDLAALRDALARHAGDPRLVAVGEIGLDHFIAGLDRERQATIFAAQLGARRRVRAAGAAPRPSRRRPGARPAAPAPRAGRLRACLQRQRAAGEAFVELGFRLGFGGAVTFERALRIRRVGRAVAAAAIVMETDSPDIPPQWRYRTAEARAAGATMRNEPAELARIGAELAALARRDGRGARRGDDSANARRVAAAPRRPDRRRSPWLKARPPICPK